jgi:hypothetical protein
VRRCESGYQPLKFNSRQPGAEGGRGVKQVRSRLTRIVIPVIGLLAVTAALALVGTAPLVLFPSSKEAGPRPPAPPASSEVGTVIATPPGQGRSLGEPGASPSQPAVEPRSLPSGGVAVLPGGSPVFGDRDGEVGQSPLSPGTERPGEGDEPGQAKGHKGKKKDKEHKGKAKGHSKDKAQGKAKGHDKWQGQADVGFAPRGAKPSHVRPSGAGKHAARSARPHARPRR